MKKEGMKRGKFETETEEENLNRRRKKTVPPTGAALAHS
jgi:hypothetical protein